MPAEPPAATAIRIRPLATADIPAVVALINAADAVDGADEGTNEAEFRQWAADATVTHGFIAEQPGGTPAGYADVHYRPGHEGAWGWIVVHPAWRRQGLGGRLAAHVRECAGGLGAAWLDVAADTRLAPVQEWLGRLGYEPIRTYMRLRRLAALPVPPAPYPSGFRVRPFQRGQDEETARHILNISFGDHRNPNVVSAEQVAENVGRPWFDPRGVFLACSAEDEIAGLCWCYTNRDENARRGAAIGWINDLGVAPAYRRRGLARALLHQGLGWLAEQGMEFVELWVEGGNRAARALYERSGFTVNKAVVDYRHYLPRLPPRPGG